MEGWVGFTDDELRRLKRQSNDQSDGIEARSNSRPVQGRPNTVGGRTLQKNRAAVPGRQKSVPHDAASSASVLPASMRLAQPSQNPPDVRSSNTVSDHTPSEKSQAKSDSPPGDPTKANGVENQDPKTMAGTNKIKVDSESKPREKEVIKELNTEEVIKREFSNVEKFQFQQKVIEEQNKKKRGLLAAAIVDRQRKAKQEASRLIKIQQELGQLDQLLALDVSIIRNKIEDISREFMDAQKRYSRAEQEFIAAKIDLHQKSDLKEALTEHLHTIIHQNEVRKAHKLTGLMEKLSMQDDGEDDQTEEQKKISKATIPSMFMFAGMQDQFKSLPQRTRSTSETVPSPLAGDMAVMRAVSNEDCPMTGFGSENKQTPSGITGWLAGWLGGKSTDNTSTEEETAKPHSRTEVVVTAPTARTGTITDQTLAPEESGSGAKPNTGDQDKTSPNLSVQANQTQSLSKKEAVSDDKFEVSDSGTMSKTLDTDNKADGSNKIAPVESVRDLKDQASDRPEQEKTHTVNPDISAELVDHNENIDTHAKQDGVSKDVPSSESVNT